MHNISTLMATSVLVLAAGIANAAPQDTTLRMSFSSVDTNSDGAIVKSELAAVVQTGFQRLDPNGDGILDPRELRDIATARAADKGGDPQKLLARVMKAKDKNGDGQLTPLELNPAAVRSVFQALDRNGDGKITLAEWNAAANGGNSSGNAGNGAGNTSAGSTGGTGVSKDNPQTGQTETPGSERAPGSSGTGAPSRDNPQTGQTGTPGNENAPGTSGVGSPTLDNPQALGGADGDTTTRDMQTGGSNGLTGMLEGGKVVIEVDTIFGARR